MQPALSFICQLETCPFPQCRRLAHSWCLTEVRLICSAAADALMVADAPSRLP